MRLSAKTSAIGQGDYLAFSFFASDRTFVFDHLDTGLLRLTVNGDWTNAGTISTDLTIEETKAAPAAGRFSGTVAEGETKVHKVDFGNRQSITYNSPGRTTGAPTRRTTWT